MMRIIENLTIRQKLTLIIMLTSTVVILLSGTVICLFELHSHRSQAAADLETIAKLIGHNCHVALSFDIPEDAEDMLSALSASPSIIWASVYDADNNIFAVYPPSASQEAFHLHESKEEGYLFTGGNLEVFYRIRLDDSVIGSICLRSDMQDFRHDLKYDLTAMGIILLLSLPTTYLLATKLQRVVSKPIFSLAETARHVAVKKDYSVRALKHGEDEIGKLTDAFNNMLFQIEQSNKAISRSEEKHRRIIDNLTGSFVFTHDARGNFNYVSSSATDVLGYSTEEFLTHYTEYLTDHPVNRDITKYKEQILKGVQQPSYEIQMYHKNGNLRWLEVSEVPVRNDAGSIIAVEGIAHDVTERKRSEEEREKLLKVLEAKNKELQSIVYVASHDLKSPLVNIGGFSAILNEDCQELIDLLKELDFSGNGMQRIRSLTEQEMPESLTFIAASAKKMQLLLDGLLQVSRVGTAEVTIAPLKMNEMMDKIGQSMQFQISKTEAQFTIGDLPDCLGDEAMINQVFSNLIDNALKYLDPERPGIINVSGWIDGERAIYCVEDNGTGIAASHVGKIFEVFHRLHPNDSTGGEGLGLSIVMRMLDRLDGKVHVESEPGKGSRFVVSLPAVKT
ncbi:MAG: ATP-binding protein [Planctomycetota bacterium]|jgi:PAS domain S-box-containing protein